MADDRSHDLARLRATLAAVAPGTAMHDGLERILRGRTGALLVLGHDRTVEAMSTGGFTLDVPFTATGLRELAKMDGAIVLDRDASRIHRAAVHLMPDPGIPSKETGTRHRTADRVARQTGLSVISVSQSMQIIAVYVGHIRYVLEDSAQILSRANQALATLERYKTRLDEVSSTLSALEIEDLVTVRDVAVVAQRLEMVTRIAREIEGYVLELGTDGRLLSLQLEELVTGVESERRSSCATTSRRRRRRTTEEVLDNLALLSQTELVDVAAVAAALGLPAARAARHDRGPARAPAAGQGAPPPRPGRRPAGRALRLAAEAALRDRRGPADGRRRRRAPGAQRARRSLAARRVELPRALRLARSQPLGVAVALGFFFGFGCVVLVTVRPRRPDHLELDVRRLAAQRRRDHVVVADVGPLGALRAALVRAPAGPGHVDDGRLLARRDVRRRPAWAPRSGSPGWSRSGPCRRPP